MRGGVRTLLLGLSLVAALRAGGGGDFYTTPEILGFDDLQNVDGGMFVDLGEWRAGAKPAKKPIWIEVEPPEKATPTPIPTPPPPDPYDPYARPWGNPWYLPPYYCPPYYFPPMPQPPMPPLPTPMPLPEPPKPEPPKPEPPRPPRPRPVATHTVVRGDTLWGIASRYCGSGPDWRKLYQANRNQIRDPNLIFPGQTFRIDCGGGPPPRRSNGRTPGPRPRPSGKPLPGASNRIKPAGRSFMTHVPLRGYRITSRFGVKRSYGRHGGIDLAAASGTPIRAAGPGRVIQAGWIGGYGWAVYIRHPDGTVTRYGHMRERPHVRVGQRIDGGTRIGSVGSTGNSTGPHLHFEVRGPDGSKRNPEHFCRF